jgi:hypothetical protein
MSATYRVGYGVQHPNRRHAEGAVQPQWTLTQNTISDVEPE